MVLLPAISAELAERLPLCILPDEARLLLAVLARLLVPVLARLLLAVPARLLVPAEARLLLEVRPRAWSLETRLLLVAPLRCATSWLR